MSNFVNAQTYCSKVFDGTHDTPKPTKIGYPLVTSKNIIGRKLNLKDTYNISESDYLSIQKRSAVSKWDVLFSMIGSIGETYLESNDKIPYAIKNVGVFSCNDEYKAKWLFYYLNSPYAKKFISNYLAGAVQKFLPLGTLRDFPIIPYDEAKKKIIDLLFNIDTKIEINNKINLELEVMAKTLYNYWFVQFDFPNENGKPYKTSGGEMVWSDELKREIPKGWEVKRIDQIESKITTGKTPSTKVPENFNGEIPFICIGDVRGDMHIVKTETTLSKKGAETQKNKYIPEGAICVTCIASPGLVGFATEESQTNQQLNSIVCEKFENRYYLYFFLQDYFKHTRAKSGNTFANMNKEDFSSIKTIKPNDEILLKFANIIQPSIDRILINTKENQKLAELRDWLLPMLMNGQVKVN